MFECRKFQYIWMQSIDALHRYTICLDALYRYIRIDLNAVRFNTISEYIWSISIGSLLYTQRYFFIDIPERSEIETLLTESLTTRV